MTGMPTAQHHDSWGISTYAKRTPDIMLKVTTVWGSLWLTPIALVFYSVVKASYSQWKGKMFVYNFFTSLLSWEDCKQLLLSHNFFEVFTTPKATQN